MTGRKPKLSREQVEAMRRDHAGGMTSDAIGKVYGVSGSTARRYLRGGCKHFARPRT